MILFGGDQPKALDQEVNFIISPLMGKKWVLSKILMPNNPGHSNKLLWSLSKLNLDIKTDLNLIKKRYKELAKKYHPDIKGNSKNSIEKFREIVEAYNYLLERYKK
jgi:preprotein translocase subunit Sec63